MTIIKGFVRIAIVAAVALALTVAPATSSVASAQAGNVVYNLYATDGFVSLADGTLLYTYGFVGGREGQPLNIMNSMMKPAPGAITTIPGGPPAPTPGIIPKGSVEAQLAGNAQFPAPIISAAVGDVVEIRLKNLGVTNKGSPNDPHSIHLHGLDVDAANDGVPETSVGAVPANSGLAGSGNVIVYMFQAERPGTYMYHCHQEASIHVAMGMYGALVIYNPGEQGAASGPGNHPGNLYGWQYDKDVVLLLSDVDNRINGAEQMAKVFNNTLYQPQYWFINGLSFPNTIHAGVGFNFNNWILAHPGYDPFIEGSVSASTKVLLRVINMGFEAHPMHMHGFHGKIIGSDARAWTFANDPAVTPFGEGMEKNTLNIGSGETYEWLIDFGQQENAQPNYAPEATDHADNDSLISTFPGGTQTRYTGLPPKGVPVSNTITSAAVIPDPLSLQPYIGGATVTGAQGIATTGQLFPFHNHEDYKATNNGVYPGGMFTMIHTLP